MLDPHRLSLLRDVVTRGSLSATAKSLGVSPSAVSQQLTRLEAETGAALLRPAGRGVRPTPLALRLVEQTERILENLEAADAIIAAAHGTLTGTLRLAAYGSFAASSLPGIVTELGEQHPDLELAFTQLDPEPAFEALTARRADLIIVDEYPSFPLSPLQGLIRENIAVEQMGAFVAGARPPGGLRELGRAPWVLEPTDSDAFRWTRNVCREAGFEPRVVFQSPDLRVQLRLVESGLAAAFLPVDLAAEARAPLHDISDLLPSRLERTVDVVIRRGSERRPDLVACIAAVRTQLAHD